MKLVATLAMIAAVVILVLAAHMVMQLMQLRAFANLATISADSLVVRLPCTGHDRSSQKAAFHALRRHARTRGVCDDEQISFDCWRRMFDLGANANWWRTFSELRGLELWCQKSF